MNIFARLFLFWLQIKKYEILSQWVPVLQNFIDDLMKMSDDLEQKLNESQSEASDGGNMSQPLVELLQIQEKENEEKNRYVSKRKSNKNNCVGL